MSGTAPDLFTASLSDVGRKRRSNQDHCGEFATPGGSRLLVCCDGMGGHQGGETASRLAVETIAEVVLGADGTEPAATLERALQEAHQRIQARSREVADLRGMGTTAVALLYGGGDAAWIAHVGDSRAYRIRGGRVQQLTQDHSIVAEQLRRGLITMEQAARLPHNELSRALGASPVLQVEVARHDVSDGDRFVLCSDGLWNLVSEREMAEAVLAGEPESAVRALVERANERGGTDNITVQVLGVGQAAPLSASDPDATDQDDVDRLAFERMRASKADETRVVEGVDVKEIWERVQQDARARRDLRIRVAAAAALLVAALLVGVFVLLRSSVRVGLAEPAAERALPDVGAPPPAEEPAP